MSTLTQLPYTNTHLITDYLIKFELSTYKIRNTTIPATTKSPLINKVKSEELESMGILVGTPIGFYQAAQVEKGRVPTKTKKYRIFNNYRGVQDFIKNYDSKNFLRPTIQLMIHLNKLLLKGIVEEWETGKLRGFSEQPNEVYDVWYGARDYYPTINYPQYFNPLIEAVTSSKERVHPLISSAALLFELIDKAPFYCCNQLTSLTLLSLLLKECGYDKDNSLSALKAVSFINDDLISAFRISKSARDMTTFIEAFCYAMSLEALALQNRYNNVYNNDVKKYSQLSDKFNSRQIKLLDYLEHVERIGRKEFAKMMGISFMTAYRDLQQLVDEGFLTAKGVGRGTYYEIKRAPEAEEISKSEGLQVFSDL